MLTSQDTRHTTPVPPYAVFDVDDNEMERVMLIFIAEWVLNIFPVQLSFLSEESRRAVTESHVDCRDSQHWSQLIR